MNYLRGLFGQHSFLVILAETFFFFVMLCYVLLCYVMLCYIFFVFCHILLCFIFVLYSVVLYVIILCFMFRIISFWSVYLFYNFWYWFIDFFIFKSFRYHTNHLCSFIFLSCFCVSLLIDVNVTLFFLALMMNEKLQ